MSNNSNKVIYMDKIKLKFSATPCLFPTNGVNVVLTLDEKGKNYKVSYEDSFEEIFNKFSENKLSETKEERPSLPKRVLDAFTEDAINEILSKDEIPNESGFEVLDGNSYDIIITKGSLRKEYWANDASIETYPLLRYLASWYRKK